MSKIEDALWQDYKDVSDLIECSNDESNERRIFMEERDKIRNELIEIEKLDREVEIKVTQIECENVRERIRNGITIGTFLISTTISLYAISKTFKFDQVATVTSTLGRNILNSVVPKMAKR